jgi:hypothetical protein
LGQKGTEVKLIQLVVISAFSYIRNAVGNKMYHNVQFSNANTCLDKIMIMKTIDLYIVIIFTLLLQGCNFSDSSENLGNDYYYRHEGDDLNDIYNKHPNPNGREIPANVVDYDFDDNIRIAKQKPKLPQDPLYEKDYKYNRGAKKFYYWLIIKNENIVLGPFDLEEFNIRRNKYRVSDELMLK